MCMAITIMEMVTSDMYYVYGENYHVDGNE